MVLLQNRSVAHILSTIKGIIAFIGLWLCLAFYAHSSIDNVRFEQYFVDDGLSQQSITVIFQDSKGFIWVGTQEGLNRFDGRSFKQFSPSLETNNSLIFSWVTSIAEDANGNLWVGTQRGLSRYNPITNVFTNFHADGSDHSINDHVVRKVWIDRSQNIWVTTRKGINKFLAEEQRFKPFNVNDENGKDVDFRAIAEDDFGGLWLGSGHHGLYRFDLETESLQRKISRFSDAANTPLEGIYSLLIDSSQRLWIGMNLVGTYVLDLTQDTNEDIVNSLTILPNMERVIAQQMIQAKDGTIWFGTEAGLAYLNEDGVLGWITHSAIDRNSLSDSTVYAVFEDDSSVLWVGTFKGLNRWNQATTQFDHYKVSGRENRSLSGNIITGISKLNEHTVLVSSYSGLDRVDLLSGEIQAIDVPGERSANQDKLTVMSSAVYNQDELWVGTRSAGLIKYSLTDGTYTQYMPRPDSSERDRHLRAYGITAIFIDRDNTIWVSTFGGGLSRYNRDTDDFTTFLHDEGDVFTLSSNIVMSIMQTDDGNLWLGTWDAGISIFNPNTLSAYRIQMDPEDPDSLSANLVWTIYEDPQNNIWVGTQGGGINLWRKENRNRAQVSFERIGKNIGLPSEVIFGILEDEEGLLWISSNRGLTRFDKETFSAKTFSYAEGLQSNEFNSGSFLQMPDGKMLFGGSSGVTAFYPESVTANDRYPRTVITYFQRLDERNNIYQELNQDGHIVVDYTDYLVGFEFVALHYAAPEKNRFKYRLLGFDEQWLETRDVPAATYTNLPPGEYTFEVISSNGDGIWNNNPAQVSVIVKPAPWLSVYAYLAYGILFCALFLLACRRYQAKLNADANYRKALEDEVAKRTADLSLANEKLRKASITDQLTGLYNRRYLFDIIKEKSDVIFSKFIASAERGKVDHENGPRIFFLMFDLDGFKPINDTYGHDAGDRMIKQVAKLLHEVCRLNDIVIRWGGDEFLVVGEINKVEELAALAERIRAQIEKKGFDIGLSQKMHLSSSIGFSVYPFSHYSPDSLSWEQVHMMADNALYKSKDDGKNKWTGLLQKDTAIPFTVMNSLSLNLQDALDKGYLKVIQSDDS